MPYVTFVVLLLICSGVMIVSITDYKQIISKLFETKKRGSLGLKSMVSSAKQLRIAYFVIGTVGLVISILGIVAVSKSR